MKPVLKNAPEQLTEILLKVDLVGGSPLKELGIDHWSVLTRDSCIACSAK